MHLADKSIKNYLNRRLEPSARDSGQVKSSVMFTICIPMRNEEDPLTIIKDIYSQDVPISVFEVVVVINAGERSRVEVLEQNLITQTNLLAFKEEHGLDNLHVLLVDNLPFKKNGVGMARKIAMDFAWHRYIRASKDNGLLVALDADCQLPGDYMQKVWECADRIPDLMAYSFQFHHRYEEAGMNKLPILKYELHLRLYRHLLLDAGHPHSQYTVGSSMACTVRGYSAHGGMNVRKAGEDFYFLQKFIAAGHHTFRPEILVYPSARVSDRVPFGTGRAMLNNQEGQGILTYNYQSYHEIREFIKACLSFEEITAISGLDWIGSYYKTPLQSKLAELRSQVRGEALFPTRFFQWFNAFEAMKMLHYLRDHRGYPSVNPLEVGRAYYKEHQSLPLEEFDTEIEELAYLNRWLMTKDLANSKE